MGFDGVIKTKRLEAGARRVRAWFAPFERFVRDYTKGLQAGDIRRLFDQDATAAYRVLTRDQTGPPQELRGFKLFWYRARIVFLGLSYKLSPVRRALFAVSVLLTLLAVFRYDWVVTGRRVGIDDSLLLFLLGFGCLLFLLVLELVDRIHVRDELELARDLQHDLLPHQAPVVPGYRFAFSYRTANEVGGDYYDFVSTGDERLAVVAGDASGHGMGAGLLMAVANAALRLAIDIDPQPERVAEMLNRVLYRTGGRQAFMTLFYSVLDPASGRLDYVCAGHPFPLLRRTNGAVEEIGAGSLPLGLRPEVKVAAGTTCIEPGDLLVLYSDGIPEAVHPPTGADFGFERLNRLTAAGGDPQQVHDRILHEFEIFLRGEARSDDISLVIIGRDSQLPPVPGPSESES